MKARGLMFADEVREAALEQCVLSDHEVPEPEQACEDCVHEAEWWARTFGFEAVNQ